MGKITYTVGFVIAISLIVVAFVGASIDRSHSLKNGATSFTVTALHPKKAILYPESNHVTTSYSTVCLKDNVITHFGRTFTTSYTRNLLYLIPAKQDICYFTVAAATKSDVGQIVVQVTN